MFRQAPGGNIEIPDEELHLEVLRTNVRKLTRVFLLTTAARVLRILESAESRGFVREKSFSPSDETHGTTPSEVCSNLGNTLIRVIQMSNGARTGEVALIRPEARTGFHDYATSTRASDRKRLLWHIFVSFLLGEIPSREIGGIFILERPSAAITQEPVAFNVFLVDVESEEAEEPSSSEGHAISIVRVNGIWHVADSELGRLLKLEGPDGGPIPPETILLLEDSSQTYVQRNSTEPGPENLRRSKLKFMIRKVADRSILAQTPEVRTLEKIPGGRTALATQIMREDPYETRATPGTELQRERITIYWKESKAAGRVTPPPDASTSIMSMFAPPAAGAPGPVARVSDMFRVGGKRKTRKVKSKRRKTKRKVSK